MRTMVLIAAISLSLNGCTAVRKPSSDELAVLDNPPPTVRAKIEELLPKVEAWYSQSERQLSPTGRPLSDDETASALALGVKNPHLVRVVVREDFPMPTDETLVLDAKKWGIQTGAEGGRCIGYVVLLKPRVASNPVVLRHELVHVGQQDRMGRTNFLRRYLTELELMGYARSPLELEAYTKQGSSR